MKKTIHHLIQKQKRKRVQKNSFGGIRKSLRWDMVRMLFLGWFFPLVLMLLIMLFLVSGKINKQVENTIVTSTDKAVEIFNMQIDDCITASKSASYMPQIRQSWQRYLLDGNKGDLYESASVFLEQQYKFNSNFKDAILVFDITADKPCFTFNNSNGATYNDILAFQNQAREIILQEAQTLDTKTKLMNIENRLYLVRNLMDAKFHPYAVLILELDKESVMDSLESIWGYVDAEVYVDGQLLLESNAGTELDKNAKETRRRALRDVKGKKTDFYRKSAYSYACKQVKRDQEKYTFYITMDNQVTFAEMWTVRYMFVIFMLFMVPFIYLIFHFFHKKVTQPLKELVGMTDEIEKGNFGVEIEHMADSNEFYRMEQSFNHMSLQLKNQFEKIYREEIALRDAKIMALQSQINPHFLNNTLEIINWEARLNENYKVSGMIEALSTMLGATMNRKAQSYISIGEELSYVDAYLYIITQRLGEKFQCVKEVEEELLDIKIPRLIIQPIVENAVEHGMDVTKQGKIVIRIYRKMQSYLYIEVEDNGELKEKEREKIHRLLTEEPDPEKERRVSLGIRNVDQRLKMIYGRECGLFINSNKENHTVSTLIIKIDKRTAQ